MELKTTPVELKSTPWSRFQPPGVDFNPLELISTPLESKKEMSGTEIYFYNNSDTNLSRGTATKFRDFIQKHPNPVQKLAKKSILNMITTPFYSSLNFVSFLPLIKSG